MAIFKKNTKIDDIYFGKSKTKIRKVYKGKTLVYQSAYAVTYYIDSGTTKVEYYKEGANCLSLATFTPSKSGYTFVGWRSDSQANSTVLTSKTMGKAAISLYAVFKKDITVTYYNNSTTASTSTKSQYYNNGNVTNPSFTLTQAAKSGWTARGWSTGTAADSAITYNNATAFTRDSNVTLYSMYQQTITVTYNGNGNTGGSVAADTGTRYYNSNNTTKDPTFTLKANGFTKTGYTFNGWSGVSVAIGATFTASANMTITASWVSEGITWVEDSKFVNFTNTWSTSSTQISYNNNSTIMSTSHYSGPNINSSYKNTENYGYAYVTINKAIGCRIVFHKKSSGSSGGSIATWEGAIHNAMYMDGDITTPKTVKVSVGTNNNINLSITFDANSTTQSLYQCDIAKIVFKAT